MWITFEFFLNYVENTRNPEQVGIYLTLYSSVLHLTNTEVDNLLCQWYNHRIKDKRETPYLEMPRKRKLEYYWIKIEKEQLEHTVHEYYKHYKNAQ